LLLDTVLLVLDTGLLLLDTVQLLLDTVLLLLDTIQLLLNRSKPGRRYSFSSESFQHTSRQRTFHEPGPMSATEAI
jgi:hypothetical protein